MHLFCLQFTVYAPFSSCAWHPSRQPLFRHPLSSRFALHGLRAVEKTIKSVLSPRPFSATGLLKLLWRLGFSSSRTLFKVIRKRKMRTNFFRHKLFEHPQGWEVLNGVGVDGVDGVGVIFPFFYAFIRFFFAFLRFSLLLLKDKGKQQQNLQQKGEFHSDPVCPDPVQNFPKGSGTSRQNSRDIPDSSLRNPRKTNFRRWARTFRPPPLRAEDPHPTGRSPDPKA